VSAANGKATAIDVSARLAFRPGEVPVVLGISEDAFREHVAAELKVVRRGRLKLYPRSEIERWLEREAERVLPEEARP
jgi:hypothetical protein